MKRFIHWPAFLAFAAIVLTVAWLINGGFGTGFWITAGIAVLAVLINGLVATVEDELLGGFNNPKPSGETKKPQ